MTTQVDLGPAPDGIVTLWQRALDVAAEISLLPSAQVFELRAAVRERLSRGDDLVASPDLRPLLNRILDLVDLSWLTPSESERLEQALFRVDTRITRAA